MTRHEHPLPTRSRVCRREGDLRDLADEWGFDAEAVWHHPTNAGLRAQRGDMGALQAGDVVRVPARPIAPGPVAAGAVNPYRSKQSGGASAAGLVIEHNATGAAGAGPSFLPGERIVLRVRGDAGQGISNIRWTGQAFEHFVRGGTLTPEAGAYEPVSNADRGNPELALYGVRPGTWGLTAHATVGGRAAQVSIAVRVVAPPFTFTAATGRMMLDWRTDLESPLTLFFLLGWPNSFMGSGIRFEASASPPASSGHLALLQLVEDAYEIHMDRPSFQPFAGRTPGLVLDVLPEQQRPFYHDQVWPTTQTLRDQDAPGGPIIRGAAWIHYRGVFQTYLMFRPGTPDPIWVPLAVMHWRYDGEAEPYADFWHVRRASSSRRPIATNPRVLPSWTANVVSFQIPPLPRVVRR